MDSGLIKPVIIEDIEACFDKTIIENELLKQGIKSFALAPLYHQNELIGVLELGSPNANDKEQPEAPDQSRNVPESGGEVVPAGRKKVPV